MNLSLPSPDEKIDLSTEHEQELIQQARISAQLAGYKSIRHFTIAALSAIVEQSQIQFQNEKKPRRAKAATA